MSTPLRFRNRLFVSFFTLACFCGVGYAQGTACIAGTWTNQEGNARVLIYETKGGHYAGKIIWLKEPNQNGQPKNDHHNPDEKLRTRPIMGLVILKGFKPGKDGSKVFDDGSIYDPKNGKTYDCKMTCMDGGKKLSIRGYMGISMIGRSAVWHRVSS